MPQDEAGQMDERLKAGFALGCLCSIVGEG